MCNNCNVTCNSHVIELAQLRQIIIKTFEIKTNRKPCSIGHCSVLSFMRVKTTNSEKKVKTNSIPINLIALSHHYSPEIAPLCSN